MSQTVTLIQRSNLLEFSIALSHAVSERADDDHAILSFNRDEIRISYMDEQLIFEPGTLLRLKNTTPITGGVQYNFLYMPNAADVWSLVGSYLTSDEAKLVLAAETRRKNLDRGS